jgi:hypothetical protein
MDRLTPPPGGTAWVIRTLASKRDRAITRRLLKAKTVVLLTPEAECVRRMTASDRVTKDYDQIRRWHISYQPSSSPDEVVIRYDTTGSTDFSRPSHQRTVSALGEKNGSPVPLVRGLWTS